MFTIRFRFVQISHIFFIFLSHKDFINFFILTLFLYVKFTVKAIWTKSLIFFSQVGFFKEFDWKREIIRALTLFKHLVFSLKLDFEVYAFSNLKYNLNEHRALAIHELLRYDIANVFIETCVKSLCLFVTFKFFINFFIFAYLY